MINYILTRIETIQQELETLKQKVLTQEQSNRVRTTQLRGIWKGVDISESLFEEAKRSLISKDLREKE
jgi:hypothetical protein